MSHWHSDPVTRTQDRHILAEHTAMPGHVLPPPRLLCTWTRTYWSSSIPIKYRRFWGNPSVCALRPRRLLLVASSYETFLDFALSNATSRTSEHESSFFFHFEKFGKNRGNDWESDWKLIVTVIEEFLRKSLMVNYFTYESLFNEK